MKEDETSSNQYKDFSRISFLLGYQHSCKILNLAHLCLTFLCLMSSRRKMNKTTKNLWAFVKTLYLIIKIAIFSDVHLVNTTAEIKLFGV